MSDEGRLDPLLERLIFGPPGEEWDDTKALLDAMPAEPGRWKVNVAGSPHPIEPWEGTCPDCGVHLRHAGGGIAFSDSISTEMLTIGLHQSEDCPAWENRRWRLWHIHTWGKIERHWKSWRWRRRSTRERRAAGLNR